MTDRIFDVIADAGVPPVMTVLKTPRAGDQATEITLLALVGSRVNPVQLTPSGLMADHGYAPFVPLFTTVQKSPS